MQSASALLKDGTVYLQSYSETMSGVWIAEGPVYTASVNEPELLARSVRDALGGSRRGVPHPGSADWRAIQAPMLRAVGAQTWRALAKGSKAVGLECERGVVTFTPAKNYELEGGSKLTEQALKIDISAEDIGMTLLTAFKHST